MDANNIVFTVKEVNELIKLLGTDGINSKHTVVELLERVKNNE